MTHTSSGATLMLIEPHHYYRHAANIDSATKARTAAARESQPDILEYMFGERPEPEVVNGVAIIPIKGPIGYNISDLEADIGGADAKEISEWIDEAVANTDVRSILLDIDSPGGSVTGVPELAYKIANLSKPVVAYTSGMMASAAYWIGSQAREVIASPSAVVGSIGVYVAIPDYSAMYEQMGIKMVVIKSGDLKGAGIEGTSLSPEQIANIQEGVTELHSDFKAAVTSKRSLVAEDSMRGQTFSGKKSATLGLVTGIANSREEAMERATR